MEDLDHRHNEQLNFQYDAAYEHFTEEFKRLSYYAADDEWSAPAYMTQVSGCHLYTLVIVPIKSSWFYMEDAANIQEVVVRIRIQANLWVHPNAIKKVPPRIMRPCIAA